MRIIFQSPCETFRILELQDQCADIENLKGDVYNPKWNTEISPETLKREEREFEAQVETQGVYGYILERWDPRPDEGWTHVDSCWGFVGQYDSNSSIYNHYIVAEMIETYKTTVSKP